jgi:aminopeptidase N
MLEPASRARYAPRLASRGHDAAILQTLHRYAADHIPPEARGDVVKTDAAVNERVAIRSQRLPQVDAWLKANGG